MSSLCCQLIKRHSTGLIKKCQPVRSMMHKGAYEGDGKTTMTILNRDADYGLMIDAVSPVGFKLNLGINVLGAMIIFPRTVLAWNISSAHDIHRDSLTLFKVLSPRPDIIILGLDNDYPRDAPFIKDFREIVKEYEMNVEILPVVKACTTFNFLNAENRYVVGALLPPQDVSTIDPMQLQRTAIRRALHEPDRAIDEK